MLIQVITSTGRGNGRVNGGMVIQAMTSIGRESGETEVVAVNLICQQLMVMHGTESNVAA